MWKWGARSRVSYELSHELRDTIARFAPGKEGIEVVERAKSHGIARFTGGAADVGHEECVREGRQPWIGRKAPRRSIGAPPECAAYR